ncbi:hypothetical protein [Microbacterium capsulatum]|uniref:Uncharacterized protein n=1 Tax=Microbacterium capsulatum TaxID=3041921 RepID=A0ABU0XI13_9MICO|nr:hypothetical protein [Microbacterium sp. ASV81]MDQ4214763.1 hypothetical protein [Microbacterium sp. ASV81]
MTNARSGRRRYRKSPGRRVWVFSELNHDLRPEQIARIITNAGLEQARLEAEARVSDGSRHEPDEEGNDA